MKCQDCARVIGNAEGCKVWAGVPTPHPSCFISTAPRYRVVAILAGTGARVIYTTYQDRDMASVMASHLLYQKRFAEAIIEEV